MSDFSDWIQSNWLELGNLILRFATLTALVWFARSALRIVATFQGHAEAPRRATAPPIQQATEAEPFNSGLRGLIPMDPAPSQPRAQVAYAHTGNDGLWHSVIKWLNTPMGDAPVAWRRTNVRRVN